MLDNETKYERSEKINVSVKQYCFRIFLCAENYTSSPDGNQIDGLPPASSWRPEEFNTFLKNDVFRAKDRSRIQKLLIRFGNRPCP